MIRKSLYTLLTFFLLCTISYAQSSSTIARRVIAGTSDPATCQPSGNNIFLNTTTDTLKICSATNTWTAITTSTAATFGITDYIEFTETAAPAQPAETKLRLYAKTSGATNSLYFKKDDGTEVDLSAAGGTGLTSLNGQIGATQTFTNDTNITIVSAADAHVITWSGTLAKARIINTAVFNDQANTYSTGSQNFVAATNLIVGNANFLIRDAGNDHNLIITPGTDLSANRVLTITTGDAARTITLNGNPTLNDWFDQNVKTTGTPTFTTIDTGQGANELFDMDQNVLTTSSPTFVTTTLSGLTASRLVFSDGSKVLVSSGDSAAIIASVSDETGTGVLVFGTSPTIATPTINGAIVFQDNIRQTFNPGADAAGLNVGAATSDPGTPSNGDIFYDSDDNLLRARINGAWVNLGAGGGGGASTALDNLASVAINTTLVSDTNNTDDLGTTGIKWRTGFFATSVNIGSIFLQASATTGSTIAILAADFNTPRSVLAFSYRMAADDSSAADVGFGRIEASVGTVNNPGGGGGIMEFLQVASGGTVSSNSARIYAKDVSGTGEMFVKDEAGNETQISPHKPGTDQWYFFSCNENTKRCIQVDMELLIKTIEDKLNVKVKKEWRM